MYCSRNIYTPLKEVFLVLSLPPQILLEIPVLVHTLLKTLLLLRTPWKYFKLTPPEMVWISFETTQCQNVFNEGLKLVVLWISRICHDTVLVFFFPEPMGISRDCL